MPKVSVIVPVYNVEQYIQKSLESLVNQTLEDIEIIIVNDGSKDDSEKIIKEYEINYPNKIKYLTKENGGLSDARNFGMPYATGEYIAFLDSDDYVDISMYETMYIKAVSQDYDMVECDFNWVYTDKIKEDIGIEYSNPKEAIELARVVAWNKLYKRELILGSGVEFPKGLRYEDVEFFYKIIPYLKKIGYVRKPFVQYIQRDNSISNTQNEKTRDMFKILENVIEYYKQKGLFEEYKTELEYIYARYLLCSSFLRMVKVPEKEIRQKLLEETWENLNKTFPNWKKNKILQTKKSSKNLYMRTVNKFTFKLYGFIFKSSIFKN